MSWLLLILTGWLPDLWLLAALAAAALYVFAWCQPSRIAAEVVRVGVGVLLGVAVYLWTYATATTAYAARVEAERERISAEWRRRSADALTEARAAATEAMAARQQVESALADALMLMPDDAPKQPGETYGGGLSPSSALTLTKILRRSK